MREYWQLRGAVQSRLMQGTLGERPEDLRAALKKALDKTGNEERLKLLVHNAVYNFKTDSSLVDPELRNRFTDTCKKWREYLGTLLDNFYGEATLEIKKIKKAKGAEAAAAAHNQYVPIKIFDWDDMLRFFTKFKVRDEEKLVRFQLLYFQIPNIRTIRTMFKELNINKFDHIGATEDEDVYDEKEKQCEDVIAEESSNFEYLNCFKFGIPPGIRYKFLHHYVSLESHGATPKSPQHLQLGETEAEVMRYFFKNDNYFCCNETSFFTFDETLLEFAQRLVTERELIFDSHEPEHDNIHNSRLPSRIIPITGFLKYMGLLTYFNKKKEKVYSIMKHILRHHISKLFDVRTSNSENIIGKREFNLRTLHDFRTYFFEIHEPAIHSSEKP